MATEINKDRKFNQKSDLNKRRKKVSDESTLQTLSSKVRSFLNLVIAKHS